MNSTGDSFADSLDQSNSGDGNESETAKPAELSDEWRLAEQLESGSLRALQLLNVVYYEGRLDESHLTCVDSTGAFPLTDYFCGDDQSGPLMSEFGFPVSSIRVVGDVSCTEQLVSAELAHACDVQAMDANFLDVWFVQYRRASEEELTALHLLISEGALPFFIDPSITPNTCQLTLVHGMPVESSDAAFCTSAVLELLALSV